MKEGIKQKRTLLLVEDSKSYQTVFTHAFLGTEFELLICNSGQEALDIIDENYIDLICSSFYLQDMDGAELCKKIRVLTRFSYKPFVLLTSVIAQDALQEALPSGVTDIYHKNDLEQLIASIRRYPFLTGQIRGRILYIEDDRAQREVMNAMLTHYGLEVDFFASAEEAWPVFMQNDYDVVITDIVLEGRMSGLGLVNQIRRQIGNKGDTPILAVTAFDDRTRRLELFHLGVTEYIIKPVLEAELFIRINSLIARKKIVEVNQEHLLAEMVYKQTCEAVMVTDKNNQIIAINPAFTSITGYTQQEVFGKKPEMLSSGKHSPTFYEEIWQSLRENGQWHGELSSRTKSGEIYFETLSISTIFNNEGEVINYVGLFTDVTSHKEQENVIEQLAHYDSLTGLPNRVLLTDRFSQACRKANASSNKFVLCILDLDDFKQINNTINRTIGDRLLIDVAERIKQTLRVEDTVSRLGGDQFILLIGDITDSDEAVSMIVNLLQVISEKYSYSDYGITITASVGMSFYPDNDVELDTMLRHTDQALYQAKVAGKNRWEIFNVFDDQQMVIKQNLLQALNHAVIDGQLRLHYQPKMNMSTGEVIGVEALIRWQNPERGLLAPVEFLPVIDHTDLDITVGKWVIENALKQMDSWLTSGLTIAVSINISAFHIQSPQFYAQLQHALALYPNVDSRLLQLEILESGALGELTIISQIVRECKDDFGVTIALDDFGTGYSSLSYLRNIPASMVKIDLGFVRDMLDNPNDFMIIDGVIGLAQSFNLDVIAEGVETIEHGTLLLQMGCLYGQGYGIAKPMPAGDVKSWMANFKPPKLWLETLDKTADEKYKKALLFKSVTTQWLNRFLYNIDAESDQQQLWPILTTEECHCGCWIRRAKFEQRYSENWLEQFKRQHVVMHDIAKDMFKQYQNGNIDLARSQKDKLQSTFDSLIKHIKV